MNHFSTNTHSLVNFSGRWMLLVLPPKNLKRVGLGQGIVTRKKSLDGGLSGNPTICHRIRTWPWKKNKKSSTKFYTWRWFVMAIFEYQSVMWPQMVLSLASKPVETFWRLKENQAQLNVIHLSPNRCRFAARHVDNVTESDLNNGKTYHKSLCIMNRHLTWSSCGAPKWIGPVRSQGSYECHATFPMHCWWFTHQIHHEDPSKNQ